MNTLTETIKKVDPYFAPLQSKLNDVFSKVGACLNQYQSIIGIDIGTSAVKCVELKEIEGQSTITKASLIALEEAELKEHKKETILKGLKKALAGMNTKKARVVCALSSSEVLTRNIVVPLMPKQELSEAIRWEMKNLIHFPVEEASLDFEISGEIVDHGVKKWSIGVVCVPRAIIDEILGIFSSLGIKLSAVIPLSSALKNLAGKLNLPPEQPVAVIEMGARLTELNIFQNGQLSFSRKLPITGAELTQAMTSALVSDQGIVDLTFEEAEKIKCLYGLPVGQESQMIEGKISAGQILALLRPKLEQLVEEIERSFNFYREEIHAGKVEKIILFGGGSQLKGLVEFLGRELGVDVKLGEALKNIRVSENVLPPKETASSRFNLALGAALGAPGGGLNLLPVELKEETKRLVKKVSFKAVIAAFVTSVLLFYIGMNIKLGAYEKKLAAARGEFAALSVEIGELREKIGMDQILKSEPFWEDVLKELSNVIPDNVTVTYIGMDLPDAISLKGVITKDNEAVEMTLSTFMLKMEEGLFKNVALVNTQKKTEGLASSEFELKCNLDNQ